MELGYFFVFGVNNFFFVLCVDYMSGIDEDDLDFIIIFFIDN